MIISTISLIMALSSSAVFHESNNTHYLNQITVNEIISKNPEIIRFKCLKDESIKKHQEIQSIIKSNHQDYHLEAISLSDKHFIFDFSLEKPKSFNFNNTINPSPIFNNQVAE